MHRIGLAREVGEHGHGDGLQQVLQVPALLREAKKRADKAGHLYTSYVMTRAFTGLYQHWGDDQRSAGREALFTSLLLTGIMELGDGLSPYGVSGEDMIMNVAGSLIGYQLATRENWARRLDLRMEYRPGGRSDPFTDYEHARYLVAVKLDGLNLQERSPLRWLELHAGYIRARL